MKIHVKLRPAPGTNFIIHIRKSKDDKFYAVVVSKNGQDVYVGQTCTRKHTVYKTAKSIFPNAYLLDVTYETGKKR